MHEAYCGCKPIDGMIIKCKKNEFKVGNRQIFNFHLFEVENLLKHAI